MHTYAADGGKTGG